MGLKKKERHPLRKIKELFSKVGTLNLILIIVGAFFVWFNWQMLCIYREYASIPETYACAVIAATIGECGICGWITSPSGRPSWKRSLLRSMISLWACWAKVESAMSPI